MSARNYNCAGTAFVTVGCRLPCMAEADYSAGAALEHNTPMTSRALFVFKVRLLLGALAFGLATLGAAHGPAASRAEQARNHSATTLAAAANHPAHQSMPQVHRPANGWTLASWKLPDALRFHTSSQQ